MNKTLNLEININTETGNVSITDTNNNLSDIYECMELLDRDYYHFDWRYYIGSCVGSFLEDNAYDFEGNVYYFEEEE